MENRIDDSIREFSKIGLMSHNPNNGIGLWAEEQELLLTLVGDSKKYLEIGSHNLGSALLVEKHAQINDIDREVFALDIKFSPWAALNYERANSSVTQLECDSNHLNTYAKELAGLDFVFIDGYHSFNQVLVDFQLIEGFMTNGGIVAFHDTSPNLNQPDYVERCLDFAQNNFRELIASTEEDFYVDEAVCYLQDHYNTIGEHEGHTSVDFIDCSIECYHPRETRLNSWIRGKTSPHSAIWALKINRGDTYEG